MERSQAVQGNNNSIPDDHSFSGKNLDNQDFNDSDSNHESGSNSKYNDETDNHLDISTTETAPRTQRLLYYILSTVGHNS